MRIQCAKIHVHVDMCMFYAHVCLKVGTVPIYYVNKTKFPVSSTLSIHVHIIPMEKNSWVKLKKYRFMGRNAHSGE